MAVPLSNIRDALLPGLKEWGINQRSSYRWTEAAEALAADILNNHITTKRVEFTLDEIHEAEDIIKSAGPRR